jgi:spore maturation protein SpmB
MTTAFRDILQGDYLSAGSRILEALMVAVCVAIGIGAGMSCSDWLGLSETLTISFNLSVSNAPEFLFAALSAGVAIIGFYILFDTPKKYFFACGLNAFLAWAVYLVTDCCGLNGLWASFFSTLAGIIVTSLYQRINLLNRTMLLTLGGISLMVAGIIWGFSRMDATMMDVVGTTTANVMLFTIIISFIIAGMRKRVNVYDAFVEGAKGGFETAIRIIPFLVAVLVGIGVFRASGAMDWLIQGVTWLVGLTGCDAEWVGALPTAIMKPLSGSGARGMMVDAMTTYGADSFVGRLSCMFQGCTDTTFYILAVYFGSVGIRHTRHAVTCGLLADLAGIIAAIGICYLFF